MSLESDQPKCGECRYFQPDVNVFRSLTEQEPVVGACTRFSVGCFDPKPIPLFTKSNFTPQDLYEILLNDRTPFFLKEYELRDGVCFSRRF